MSLITKFHMSEAETAKEIGHTNIIAFRHKINDDPTFPEPDINLGGGSKRYWLKVDIAKWVAQQTIKNNRRG